MPDDFYAKPLKNETIASIAYLWRETLGIPRDAHNFNIVEVVENVIPLFEPAFSLIVEEDSDADSVEAYTEFAPPKIVVRESVYLAANDNDGRARWTFAHELGHLTLHDAAVPLARAPVEYRRMPNLPPYASAEKQAEKFAAAFLAPIWIVKQFATPSALSSSCGISLRAARIQLDKVSTGTRF